MADNKLLLKRASDEDFLAEDDPLAELSRLVGFDPAPVAKAGSAQRREPAFDLEDELLKELEIYEQPAPPAAAAAPAYAPVEPAVYAPEPVAAPVVEVSPAAFEPPVAPEPVREPVILEAVETLTDAVHGRVYERPASHPVFDLEDEILREFSAFDARRVSHADEHPVAAEIVHQALPRTENVPVELHDVPERAVSASLAHGRDIYESFRGDDLDDAISGAWAPQEVEAAPSAAELEELTAIAAPAISDVLAAPEIEAAPTFTVSEDLSGADLQAPAEFVSAPEAMDTSRWGELDIKAALAAEGVSQVEVEPEVRVDQDYQISDVVDHDAAFAAQSTFVAPSIDDYVEQVGDDLVSQDFADALPLPSAPVAPAIEPVTISAASQSADYGLDALLAEVEKYPVAENTARWGVQSKPAEAADLDRAVAPVVQDFVAPTPVSIVEPTETVAQAPASFSVDAAHDDGSFDIDLGEIELDLSDINEGEMSAAPDLMAEMADAPVMRSEPVVHQPAQPADSDYSSLPFDPSQIAQEDETFEAIAEMDVPEVPVVHEEEKPAQHPEYDIDLDAEMAQLFATATAQSSTAPTLGLPGDAPASVTGAAPRNPATAPDLDEFERALEEDFRRSFAENRTSSTPDRVALAPVYAEAAPSRSRRSVLLLASATVAVVLVGGAGVFAYMSGDAKILTSSEPKVIMADTDPVKVVPEDPGGKQVPNQNKAVYDRVAGEKSDEAKQESLLTSNEEPVDVVQRTLMPETLPMDDDTMSSATPTGDTVDPRLLPDEAEQDRVTTTNKVVSGVSPRKVKTMVVRPDGSLVEREVTEEDVKQQASNDAELMKIAQKAAQDAATASDSQADDIAKAIDSVPERLAPNDTTAAKPIETANDATVAADDAKPEIPAETKVTDIAPVEPVKIEDDQPTVAEKPVEDVVTSEARPEPVVAEEKPVEVANDTKPVDTPVVEAPVERSIAVDDQPVVDADAAAKVADTDAADADAPVRKVKTTKITPVPEVRPVDQPVNVVGTVTDQGTVQTDVKPQEIAVADAAKQPAETTAVPTGSYVIQIASLPSEAEAQTSYSRLSAKFGGIIGGKGVDIRRAEIKNKGTYYRVRIPAGSKQDAQALCSQYKAAGGSCLVSK